MARAKTARPASARGFTIVEILVVIAIIALLSAILLPVLGRARENGKRSSCSNNLRQIALGLQQYTQDNNRRFPPTPAISDGSEGWVGALRATIKNSAVFQCPSESSKGGEPDTDYWLNAALLGKSDVRVNTPVSIITLGDGVQGKINYVLPAGTTPAEAWKADDPYATRHLGGANYAFADGHVKWLRPSDVKTADPPDGTNKTFVVG